MFRKVCSTRRTLRFVALCAAVLTFGCAEENTGPPAATTGRPASRGVVSTDAAPAAIGPYSQAIRVGPHLYLSGQIGIDPSTGEMVAGGVEHETRQVLANVTAVLEAAGFGPADVVQSVVYLADLDDYARVNHIYSEFFPESPPARAALEVARLPKDARVEIMMTAYRPSTKD